MKNIILSAITIILVIVYGLYINLVDDIKIFIALPMFVSIAVFFIYVDALIKYEVGDDNEDEIVE